jgi:hypothetical protein
MKWYLIESLNKDFNIYMMVHTYLLYAKNNYGDLTSMDYVLNMTTIMSCSF